MITKDTIKNEIDNVRNEYLDLLFRIIKTLEISPVTSVLSFPKDSSISNKLENSIDWSVFIDETAGCLADNQIKRGEQGNYEDRELMK